MLVCRDGASEIDFCKAVFDATELSRRLGDDESVVHATLSIEGTLIMIHGEFSTLVSRSPELDGSSSVVVYLYVEDVDLTLEKAVRAGAKIDSAPPRRSPFLISSKVPILRSDRALLANWDTAPPSESLSHPTRDFDFRILQACAVCSPLRGE
jgi:uncharacterized glyoxalase superfamily protein PhnB